MAMFLESFLNFNDSEAVSDKYATCIEYLTCILAYKYLRKLASLCSEKLDRSKLLQNIVSLNSKSEIREN